jgi:hypothetical protein
VEEHISRYRTSVSKYSYALASSRGDEKEYADTILVRIRAVALVGALSLYRLLYMMIHTDRENVGDDRHSNINNHYHNDDINVDARSNDESTQRFHDYAAISSVISSLFQSFDGDSTAAALQLINELMLRHCSHDAFQHFMNILLSSRITSMQGEACSMSMSHNHHSAASDDESILLKRASSSSHAHTRGYYQELPEILKILCELSYEVLLIISDGDGTNASVTFRAGIEGSSYETTSSTMGNSSSNSSYGEFQRGVNWSMDLVSTSEHLISVINSSLDLLLVMVSPVYISIVEEMSLDFYLFCGKLSGLLSCLSLRLLL